MSRDIRDVLAGASPDVTTRPDMTTIRRAARVRRRIRAAGTATALTGAIVLGIAGVPWVSEQMAATPEPPPPAGPPTDDTTSDAETPSPTPTSDDETTDDEPDDPVANGAWELIGTPDAFDVGWRPEVHASVAVDETLVAVGTVRAEPTEQGAESFGQATAWRAVGDGDWERIDDVEVPSDLESWSVSMAAIVADEDGTLIAVGNASGQGQSVALAWRSTDLGESWNVTRVEEYSASHVSDVAWVGDRFIAVGLGEPGDNPEARQVSAAWSSTDGQQWERIGLPEHDLLAGTQTENGFISPSLEEITWSPSTGVVIAGFLAVDGPATTFTLTGPADTDAASWTVSNSPPLSSLVATDDGVFAWTDPQFDEGDELTRAVITTSDGGNWETVPEADIPDDRIEVRAIAVTADGDVAAGGMYDSGAMLWRSTDDLPSDSSPPDEQVFPEGSVAQVIVERPDGGVTAFGSTAPDGRGDILLWERSR